MTIRCEEAAPLLEKVFDGEGSPEEKRLVEAHVRECAACARDWSFLERVQTAAASAARPEPPALYWEVLPGKIMGRIMSGASPTAKRRFVAPAVLGWAGAVAAALVAAFTAVEVLRVPQKAPALEGLPAPARPVARAEDDRKERELEGAKATANAPSPPPRRQLADKAATASGRVAPDYAPARAPSPGVSGSLATAGERADAQAKSAPKTAEAKPADLKKEEGVPGPPESRRKASTLSAEQIQAAAPAPPSPTVSADEFQALKESEKVDRAEGAYRALVGRLESGARARSFAAEPDNRSNLERERALWREFVTQNPESVYASEALYRVAKCSIRLYELNATEARRKEAIDDATAYLKRVGSGDKFEEIRRTLDRIQPKP